MRILLLFVFLLDIIRSAATNESRYAIEPGSKLVLAGTTNVNTFHCHCSDPELRNTYHLKVNPHAQATAFEHTALLLPAKTLNCGNKLMNRDMFTALKADAFPQLRLQLGEVSKHAGSRPLSDEWQVYTVSGALTIAGHTRTYPFHVKAKLVGENRYRFVCFRELKLSDFGIEPPCGMGGLVRVNDCIELNFDLLVSTQDAL